MDEQTRRDALRHSRHALDLIEKRELTRVEQDAVVADCVRNFAEFDAKRWSGKNAAKRFCTGRNSPESVCQKPVVRSTFRAS